MTTLWQTYRQDLHAARTALVFLQDLEIVFKTYEQDPGRIGLAGEEGLAFLDAAKKLRQQLSGKKEAPQENGMEADETEGGTELLADLERVAAPKRGPTRQFSALET